MTVAPRYSPTELAARPRASSAHRRAGRRHRRPAGSAGGHRGRGRGQDRDDGRPGGLAGRQRLRRSRTGAGADVHPQGRRATAAPGPVPAGPAGRRRPGSRRRQRGGRDRSPSAPITRSPARCCANTACCCRSSPTPGCSAKPSCGSWLFDVVCAYPGELDTDKTPATLTSMVLRLSGQLAEHLVDTDQLRDTHVELERLVHTLPAGAVSARPRARSVAAAHAGHADRAHRAGAADRRPARQAACREGRWTSACRWPRRRGWREQFPQVGCRTSGPLPGRAARRVPGHRARAAGRAVGAVRRWGRRRPGPDRGRRPDPVHLRLAWRLGHQPAAVQHRLPARRRQPRACAGTAHQLA